jgi:uncharacterized protein (TIGR00290 family)
MIPRGLVKAAVSWSSGKDAAFAMVEAQRLGLAEIVATFTTVDERDGHIPIHGVDASSLARQVEAIGLPHFDISLPDACPNVIYEECLHDAFTRLRRIGIEHVVFGDLFLEDIRWYRDRLLAKSGMTGIYPLWQRDTRNVSGEILSCGIRARIVAVDSSRLDPSFVGRAYDAMLIRALPPGVDPCGENGEFHTFAEDGPMMRHAVTVDLDVLK